MKVFLTALMLGAVLYCTSPAVADTLTFTSVGGANADGVYVYPYNFAANINGSTSSVSLMCVDFNREITLGETWGISESLIPTDTSTMSTDLRALALLFYGAATHYANVSAADYQFAAWDIFDPSDIAGKSGFTATAQAASSAALLAAQGVLALPPGFAFSNVALYAPTSNTTGWTDGIPQRFIGFATPNLAQTPEPSSLLLLGTGMFAIAGMVRRRCVAP